MTKKYFLSSYFWFQHLLNTIPKSQKLYLLTLFNWPELSFLLTNVKNEGKERRPSMVSHTCNLCSALNPSKWTHTAVRSEETHTHTLWTHTWSSGQPMLRRPGSSWGFGALLKGLTSVVELKVERVLNIHSPADTETRTHDLQVTSQTL